MNLNLPTLTFHNMPEHTISGSFKVNNKKEYYLSQQQLADGWRKVLPRSNMVETEKDGKTVKERQVHYNEVNLAQFPPYLFKYLKSGKEIYYDSFFKFKILRTEYDETIMKLYHLLSKKYPSKEEQDTIKTLNEFLKSNDITGWMTIKASK